jgi:hypothetical protein
MISPEFNLPETKEQWLELKAILINTYGLIDEPQTWTLVLSKIQGVPMPELTMSFLTLVGHYKRWKIAGVLQAEKLVYIKQLEDRLTELEAENAKSQEQNEGHPGDMQERTHNFSTPVQGMSQSQVPMG